MSGELTLEKLKVDKRLRNVEGGIIELKSEVKHHNHFAEERQKAACKKLDEILDFIHTHHKRKDECMRENKKYTKQAIAWTLGIPTTIITVIFAIMKLKELFGG